MKVTGSMRAIKVLATALVLSVFALMATSCSSCTKGGEADSTGDDMQTTVPTSETTTPITGPDGIVDSTDTENGTTGGVADLPGIEETTHSAEDTRGLIRRLF